ncbi:glutamate synthase [Sulfurifustis variabilis]|uniref:Glutamate synthase n=1 Tax=Sulfurifustis variabilis TaxID=1675686 RepID=A0A1B4V518_9GAMM|nr:NAD(P)-binding protein [Sulfurifustis variabilis]BAU48515.1 glutamate synthase [Sulfurifustis variabilis]
MSAPANKVNTKPGHTFRKFKDGEHRWRSYQEQIFTADETDKCPTYVHKTPPCQASCPSGEDIRGWLNIVRGIEKPAKGTAMQEYAFRRLTDANPFPSVMGRVCPAPCQTGCNRNAVEEFVGINSVEQYIGDTALSSKYAFKAAEQESGKKVAVIGGGPAGLAAAYQLRRKGHAVTIFEKYEGLGGMMRYGIPGYRMPRDVLDGEINRIVEMGVEVRLNTRVGTDVKLEELEKNYDAILFAIGAQSGRALPVPGADAPNCVTGVAFLEAFNQGRLRFVSNRVLVIGGGDTSIDVVSVARRLGYVSEVGEAERPENVVLGYAAHDAAKAAAKQGADVMLISRQPIEKMNAAKHEIDDAIREGVKIRGALQPVEVIKDANGRATALKVIELDYSKGKPEPKPGTEQVLEADLIVAAIGQAGDFQGLEPFNNGKGLIAADKFYQVPNKPKYFAAGDIIRPHLLTTVIGQASVAADTIDQYFRHQEFAKRPKVDVHHFNLLDKLREVNLQPKEFRPSEEMGPRPIDQGLRGTSEAGKAVGGYAIHNFEDRASSEVCQSNELFLGHFAYEPRNKREEKVPSAEEVLGHFEERVIGLAEPQAIAEAKRCMSCGLCFECDNCVIYCPQTAVKRTPKSESTMGRYVYTDYDLCIGCHICADVCPTGYIKMGMGDH